MAAAMIKAVKFAKTIKAYFYHTRATTAATERRVVATGCNKHSERESTLTKKLMPVDTIKNDEKSAARALHIYRAADAYPKNAGDAIRPGRNKDRSTYIYSGAQRESESCARLSLMTSKPSEREGSCCFLVYCARRFIC